MAKAKKTYNKSRGQAGTFEQWGGLAGLAAGHTLKPRHTDWKKDTYATAVYMGGGGLGGAAVGRQIDKYRDKKTRAGTKPLNRVGKKSK